MTQKSPPTLVIQALLEQLIQSSTVNFRNENRGEALRDILEIDLQRASDMVEEGYEHPESKKACHPWVLRLEDGRMYSLEYARRAGPAKKVFKKAVEDYLTGRKPFKKIPNLIVPGLPRIARRVLESEGLNPDACEQLGVLARRFILITNDKHHEAIYCGNSWKGVIVHVANDPTVFVGNERVTIHIGAAESVKTGLEGKMLTDVIDHPAFADYRVRLVTTRPTGMTLHVKEDTQ